MQVFSCGSDGKESACDKADPGSTRGQGRSPREGNDYHSSTLAWRIPWTESLVGYTPWGLKELDTTEQLTHSKNKNQIIKAWKSKK